MHDWACLLYDMKGMDPFKCGLGVVWGGFGVVYGCFGVVWGVSMDRSCSQ